MSSFGKNVLKLKWPPLISKPAKPKKVSLVVTEHVEQVRFVKWMRETHPKHKIFAIPNGGGRHMAEAVNLKKEGVSKGVPDLFIPSLALWIEMKRSIGGVTSKEQKEWIKHLIEFKYHAYVCNGCDKAIETVNKVLSNTTYLKDGNEKINNTNKKSA